MHVCQWCVRRVSVGLVHVWAFCQWCVHAWSFCCRGFVEAYRDLVCEACNIRLVNCASYEEIPYIPKHQLDCVYRLGIWLLTVCTPNFNTWVGGYPSPWQHFLWGWEGMSCEGRSVQVQSLCNTNPVHACVICRVNVTIYR